MLKLKLKSMKKKFFIPVVVILFLTAAFSFTSCEKDKPERFKLTLTAGNGGVVQAFSNEERTKAFNNLSAIDKGMKLYLKATPDANAVVEGWTGIDGNPIDDTKTLAIVTMTGNKTVTVNFTVSQIVTFELNGGTPAEKNQIIKPNEKVSKPKDPTKPGYAFVGWYKEVALLTLWNFDQDVVGTQSMTLYAKWDINSYTVTLDPNGGDRGQTTSILVAHNGTQDPNSMPEGTTPTRANHEFVGWCKDQAATILWTAEDKVTSDMTLYAKWIALHTITFMTDGGSPVTSVTVKNGEKVTRPEANPTKEGFVFENWYEDAARTTLWNFDTRTVTQNISLYAKWTPIKTVTFNTSGGSDVPQKKVTQGEKVTKPETDPTKTGHTFAGWYEDDTHTTLWNFENRTVVDNIILYAKWTPNTYTVVYNKNNSAATGTTTNSTHTYDDPKNLTANGYSLTGHEFVKWATSSSGEPAYENEASVINLASEQNATVTLYALWSPKSYNVTFDGNKPGSATAEVQNLPTTPSGGIYNQTITSPNAIPSLDEYSFIGWYTTADWTSGIEWNFATSKMPANDVTLYARWAQLFTVTFDYNDGSATTPATVDFPEGVSRPLISGVSKDNYTITWSENPDGTGPSYVEGSDFTMGNTAITLYAQWTYIGGYSVGNIYPDPQYRSTGAGSGQGVKRAEGVVFETGKIVGLDEQIGKVWYYTDEKDNFLIGTNDTDGLNNTTMIFEVDVTENNQSWEISFPVFNEIKTKGTNWYLPAINEFQSLYNNLSSVNESITNAGGTTINNVGGNACKYWSSSEIDAGNVKHFDFSSGSSGSTNKNLTTRTTRAIKQF